MDPFEKVKDFLRSVEEKQIHFKQHFYDQMANRPISESRVRKTIKSAARLLAVEEQQARDETEEKYKLWLKLSNRYCLVLIIIISGKNLYIITGWNSDRKWQKSNQK
jgi:hypothetical protein